MPIICKWLVLDTQQSVNFNTVDEMIIHPNYDDFTYINMDKTNSVIIPELPTNLQILYFSHNKIFTLPQLPSTLRSLIGTHNRISKFPIIDHCNQLEDIDFFGNDIEELNILIPSTVQTINLDFNRIRRINYELISSSIKLSISYNFVSEIPPKSHIHNIKYDHNNIPLTKHPVYLNNHHEQVTDAPIINGTNAAIINGIDAPIINGTETPIINGIDVPIINGTNRRINQIIPLTITPIINGTDIQINQIIHGIDKQSVHNSSIQKSANQSLNYVLHYVPNKEVPSNIADVVKKEYYKHYIKKSLIRSIVKFFSFKLSKTGIIAPPIRRWVESYDIHSQFGVTYKILLKQVWAIIEDHEHKNAMKEVLFQELNDSKGVCFTGRFTRTLNALTGFIEQVQIGIDSQEQMRNRIIMTIKNTKSKLGNNFLEEAKKEVRNILEEFEIPTIEHDAWLDAIE